MDARGRVVAAAERRASALADGDVGCLTGLLHEHFRWTSYTGETFDREEYIRRNTSGLLSWRSQTLDNVDVVVVGQTAVLSADVTDVVNTGAGRRGVFRMPVTQVWVQQDGQWRCLAGHAGPRRT